MSFAALASGFSGGDDGGGGGFGGDISDTTNISTAPVVVTFGDFSPPSLPTNNLLLIISLIVGATALFFISKRF
jgi:hypothetical protein